MDVDDTAEIIRCPFCNSLLEVPLHKDSTYFPYPKINDDIILSKLSNKLFRLMECWGFEPISDTNDHRCINCHNLITITQFLKAESDPRYDEKTKERIVFLKNRGEIISKPPVLVRFLDYWYTLKILPYNNKLIDSFFLIILPLIPFFIIPGSREMLNSISFLCLFFLFGFLIYAFNLFNETFSESLRITELPFDLSEDYKNGRFGTLFEFWKIKDTIYNYWSVPLTNKKIHHATAYGLLTSGFYLSLYWIFIFILHRNLFVGQTEYNFLLSVAYLPYWLILCFILGNIACYILGTSGVLAEYFEKIPVKFNIAKTYGGFDSIFSLCLLIFFQMVILCLIAIVWLYGLITTAIITMDLSIFLKDKTGLILLVIIVGSMVYIYIRPLLVIIKKYQNVKKKYILDLGEKINSFSPSQYEYTDSSELQNLQFKYNLAKSLPDWPTKIQLSLLISFLIPILSFIIQKFLLNPSSL